jgi:hypothetical protein
MKNSLKYNIERHILKLQLVYKIETHSIRECARSSSRTNYFAIINNYKNSPVSEGFRASEEVW